MHISAAGRHWSESSWASGPADTEGCYLAYRGADPHQDCPCHQAKHCPSSQEQQDRGEGHDVCTDQQHLPRY